MIYYCREAGNAIELADGMQKGFQLLGDAAL